MAIKGLSVPVFGQYNYDDTTKAVTYTDGVINPTAVSYTATLESSDNNPFYSDNRITENDMPRFSSGTISLETDDLVKEVLTFLLGAKEVSLTVGSDTVMTLVYDDDLKSANVGLGIIEFHQNNDVDNYKAIIFNRVMFSIPEDAATTKGESVEWQTKTIEGTISRSEEVTTNTKYPWKMEAWFDTEDDAISFLKSILGVTDTPPAEPST